MFEILQHRDGLTAAKFRYIAAKQMKTPDNVEKLLDVMLWNGSLGVLDNGATKYIFDSGYKRQYLATLVNADEAIQLTLHPTLVAALGPVV